MEHRATGAALVALAALLAAALVAAALLVPRSWAVRVGAPGDAYFVTDLFPPEGVATPLRWTREAASLRLYGAYAGPARLELRLYREPVATTGRAWPLALRAGATPLAGFEAGPGWRRYAVLLPPGATLTPLTLTSPTFAPGGGDARVLGVALAELKVAPVDGPPPLGHALGRATWLGALLALLGVGAWLLDAWCRGPMAAPGRPLRVAALVGGLGVALAAWAWLGPPWFAWALPTRWAVPGWAVAMVALLWLARRANRPAPGRLVRVAGVAGALLAAHVLLLAPAPALWQQVAALMIVLAPGALAARALLDGEADGAEHLFLAVAGGLGVAALLGLALHALPGPLPRWALLVASDGLALVGLAALARPRHAAPTGASASGPPPRWLALPLLLAAGLRLWGLGVGQFQGDEAYALMLARGVLHGQEEILLVHMKGPVEALLPATILVAAGSISETAGRLPFALAGLAAVIGVWSLAARLIGGRAGAVAALAAALAVASDGLLVAFGRVVQYQTVVMALSAAALWLAWRFYEGASAARTLPAAAVCAAVAVLAHYDGIYVAPALVWLVLAGGYRRGWGPRRWVGALALPLVLGLGLTLSFYVPFALHEHFGRTLRHLGTRSGQGSSVALYNNLPDYGALLSVYTSHYVAVAAGLALLVVLAALLARFLRPRAPGYGAAALLVAGGLAAVLAPARLAVGPNASLAALLVLPPLLALILAPRLPAGLRAIVIWMAGALAAHAFLIVDPRTHFYTMHLPAWLLVAWGAGQLWDMPVPRLVRPLRAALAASATTLVALGLAYSGMTLLRPWPEYERAFPATLIPFFRPPGGEQLPDDGLFGFPARDGWKAAAVLFQQGVLRGSYDTNQELFTPGWYLRGQFKCQRDPDYFLTANGARPLYIPPGYHHVGTITEGGVRALEIYSREPAMGPPQVYAAESFAAAYDAAPVPNFPLRRLLSGVVPQVRLDALWQGGFALRGFDQDRSALGPGDVAFVTLYWRAASAQPGTLAPALLALDESGRVVAEASTYCGGVPAEVWHQTYVNDTPFRLEAATLPPGSYTLHAGVRDIATGRWVPLEGGGELLELGALTVTK